MWLSWSEWRFKIETQKLRFWMCYARVLHVIRQNVWSCKNKQTKQKTQRLSETKKKFIFILLSKIIFVYLWPPLSQKSCSLSWPQGGASFVYFLLMKYSWHIWVRQQTRLTNSLKSTLLFLFVSKSLKMRSTPALSFDFCGWEKCEAGYTQSSFIVVLAPRRKLQRIFMWIYKGHIGALIVSVWHTGLRSEDTYTQHLSKFILQKLFQLLLTQSVLVSLLAGVFSEGSDEESHGVLNVRHDDVLFFEDRKK